MRGLAEVEESVLPRTTQTNPRTYRANAIPPHAHVQICTHHFAGLSSCTRPPIIPRESMRQETKQIPCCPPHRTVTRHGSAQRKAERSHSPSSGRPRHPGRHNEGCQPTMRNAAVCRTQPEPNNQSSPPSLSNMPFCKS